LDLDDFLDLEGEREREAGGPRATPEAARLEVVVFRGLGVAGLLLEEDFFAFFGFDVVVFVVFFALDGLRPLEEVDGLRPLPLPVPVLFVVLVLVAFVVDFDLLLGFFAFVTRAGDLLRLLRTFFVSSWFGFRFFL